MDISLCKVGFPSLELAPMAALRLHGREAMNELFSFHIVVEQQDGAENDCLLSQLLLAEATLWLPLPDGGCSEIGGIVASAEFLAQLEGGRRTLSVHLVPRAWLLSQRKITRIFQNQTVTEIGGAVFTEHGVPVRFVLLGKLPVREYCVQYEETDWAFVTRLFAEAGLFFWFERADEEGEPAVMVVSDTCRAYPLLPRGEFLRYRFDQGGTLQLDEDMVTEFRPRVAAAPTSLTLRNYDFQRPLLDLTASKVEEQAALAPMGGAAFSHYEHHSDFQEPDADQNVAATMLNQLRTKAKMAAGRSVCRRLFPGAVFHLTDHEVAEFDGGYVVTALLHEGRAFQSGEPSVSYENRFEVVPMGVGFAPPKPERRVCQALETAIVVGPKDQEIFCDRFGRIKVQFHWDREGQKNEKSSCFLRVVQTWAGSDFGHQFVPRVGMEVLVSFLGGDPDRPVVVGCVPNAHNPPQYGLPQNASRSGIRTRSTPGGHGWNEIAFEDKAGDELLFLRAQRNFVEEVGRDRVATVGRNSTLVVRADCCTNVGNDFRVESGADMRLLVGGTKVSEIAGDERTSVGGARRVTINRADTKAVRGCSVVDIAENRALRIGGSNEERVGGAQTRIVEGEENLIVHGQARRTFSDRLSVNAAGGVAFSVGSKKKSASAAGSVSGDFVLRGAGVVEVASDQQIRLRVGKSFLEIGPKEVRIQSEAIVLEGTTIAARSEKADLSLGKGLTFGGESVRLESKDNAILELSKEAILDGNKVKIKPGLSAELAKRDERQNQAKALDEMRVLLFDLSGDPIPNVRYELSAFGYFAEGSAPDSTVKIPMFPDVEKVHVRWARPFASKEVGAEDESYEFEMDVYLQTDGSDTAEALRRKLHNLGHTGADLEAATRHFQASAGISASNSLGDVEAAVDQCHGGGNPIVLKAS